eukprot:6489709-Amphidinium_carterae.1
MWTTKPTPFRGVNMLSPGEQQPKLAPSYKTTASGKGPRFITARFRTCASCLRQWVQICSTVTFLWPSDGAVILMLFAATMTFYCRAHFEIRKPCTYA